MPRRDGTGPMGNKRETGRQMGSCFDASGAFSVAYGRGCHLHGRLRDGTCCYSPAPDRNALTAEKEFLKNKLKLIDRKLNEVSGKSTDQPNG